MLELIKDVQNKLPVNIQKLQKSKLPLVMYGAGSYAADVSRLLLKNRIEINNYCVDKNYLGEKQTFINNKVVESIEDVSKRYPKFNIVIGIADYLKAEESFKKLNLKQAIFFFDTPDLPKFFDYNFIKEHAAKIQETYNMLSDKESKEVFLAFINAKISGDPRGLYYLAKFNQYFPGIIALGNNESLVDCGAYDGDTILNFLDKVNNKYHKIYAFEPDKDNYKQLQKTISRFHIKDIETFNTGCWSGKKVVRFKGENNVRSSVSLSGGSSVNVDKIDNIIRGRKVTYIKMDIEGAELEALRGAKNVIKHNKPKLAICVYHKPNDLISIPQYIKGLVGDYKFYLRQHQFVSWDMVLYALPKK